MAEETLVERLVSEARILQAEREIAQLRRERHHIRQGEENDFTIRDMSELGKAMMPWKQ